MNKLISICLLLFLVVTGNAQEKSTSKYSELNQDQLSLELTKSKKTIKAGKILCWVGLGTVTITTSILMIEGLKAIDGTANENTASAAAYIDLAGVAMMWAGIPVWIVGATKRHKIELELVKYNPKGSSSINGVGIKIRF